MANACLARLVHIEAVARQPVPARGQSWMRRGISITMPPPDGADVTADVVVDNKDIGFIKAGQHAEIKLETFNFTRYGTVPAEVLSVSADAVADEKRGAIFPATLRLDQRQIRIDGMSVKLSPGMNVTAEIKIGRRRVIDYLLSPLKQLASTQFTGVCRRRLIPAAIATVSLLGLAGCERWELDRQMEALCKKDGGVKVYETVTLPLSEFSDTGVPLARYIPIAKSVDDYLGLDYRYIRREEILVGMRANTQRGEGELSRWYSAVHRRADRRLLGESVSYSRSGGDGFTFGFQPSGNVCPRPRVDLITSVFIRGV